MQGFERFEPVLREIDVGAMVVRIWRPPDMESLIDLENFDRDGRIPYWADVWESSRVLAENIAKQNGLGRTLLELGCGLGLPSIVAARRGFSVLATDYEETALEGVRFNAIDNLKNGSQQTGSLSTRVIDWRSMPEDLGHYDLVTAADVLYEDHHAALVAKMINATMADGGTALVADPRRAKAERFADECRTLGLCVKRHAPRRSREATDGAQVEIFELSRARRIKRRDAPRGRRR